MDLAVRRIVAFGRLPFAAQKKREPYHRQDKRTENRNGSRRRFVQHAFYFLPGRTVF